MLMGFQYVNFHLKINRIKQQEPHIVQPNQERFDQYFRGMKSVADELHG